MVSMCENNPAGLHSIAHSKAQQWGRVGGWAGCVMKLARHAVDREPQVPTAAVLSSSTRPPARPLAANHEEQMPTELLSPPIPAQPCQ